MISWVSIAWSRTLAWLESYYLGHVLLLKAGYEVLPIIRKPHLPDIDVRKFLKECGQFSVPLIPSILHTHEVLEDQYDREDLVIVNTLPLG